MNAQLSKNSAFYDKGEAGTTLAGLNERDVTLLSVDRGAGNLSPITDTEDSES